MKNLEIKTLQHETKSGNIIKMRYSIDYDKGDVSFVDYNNGKKHFVFAERGLEYMQGWDDILDAMKLVVKEMKKALEHDLAEKTKFLKEEYDEARGWKKPLKK